MNTFNFAAIMLSCAAVFAEATPASTDTASTSAPEATAAVVKPLCKDQDGTSIACPEAATDITASTTANNADAATS